MAIEPSGATGSMAGRAITMRRLGPELGVEAIALYHRFANSAGASRYPCATMCYMHEDERPVRVGVRELRQNLSVYLRRVKAGETLEVTEQGIPVGRLTPLPARRLSRLEELVEGGDARPATARLADLPMPTKPAGRPLSGVLAELRAEERG